MPHAQPPSPATQPTMKGVYLHVNDDCLTPTEVLPLRESHPYEPLDVLRHRYETEATSSLRAYFRVPTFSRLVRPTSIRWRPAGVLKPGSLPVQGLFDSEGSSAADFPGIGAGTTGGNGRPGDSDKATLFVELALKAHTEDWYCGSEDGSIPGFCNHPRLRDFVSKFTQWGEDTLEVKRSLLRNNTPGNNAIGVHYDQIFMRYGEPTSVTAWVPMGDVKLEGGGLIYLEDGHILGAEIEADFTAKAKAAGMSDEETRNAFNANMMSNGLLADGPADFGRKHGKRWLVAAYEAGDVVFHTPYMIHASTKNYDPEDRIRLGTDLRFVNSARPWDTRWNSHYRYDDGV